MTRTRPLNRLLDNLSSLISFSTSRLLEGLQNSRTKNYLSDRHFSFPQYQRTLFIQLTYSCFLVTIFPPIAWLHFLQINTHATHNCSNRWDEGLTLKTSALNSLQWPIYIINSVNNTKLHCCTLPLMQHHSFLRNLPPLPAQQSSTQHELAEKKDSFVLINKVYVTDCYHWVLSPFNTG